jgi:hypothetical protein
MKFLKNQCRNFCWIILSGSVALLAQEPSSQRQPSTSASSSKNVDTIIGKELRSFNAKVVFQKNGEITANPDGQFLLGERRDDACTTTTKKWSGKWSKKNENSIDIEATQEVLIKCVDGFTIPPMKYTNIVKGTLVLEKAVRRNTSKNPNGGLKLKGKCTITLGTSTREQDVVLYVSDVRDESPTDTTTPPQLSDQVDQDLEDMKKLCGEASNSANENNQEAMASTTNVLLLSTSIVVNGKEFPVKIYEWGKKTAQYNPPANGDKFATIYLPPFDLFDGLYYGRGLHLANELGNLITDARDGAMDYRNSDAAGKAISRLEAEAESDAFSINWGKYNLTGMGANPLLSYISPTDVGRDVLLSMIDAPNKKNPWAWSRNAIEIALENYNKRRTDFLHAQKLISNGQLKEAFDYLVKNGHREYACAMLSETGSPIEGSN